LSKDLEEHISTGLHKSNKEKYYNFKKYYHEKVKSGLKEVDQFIQEYQLDSPNVTKIYGSDDFRINAFVTSFKECKTRMVKLHVYLIFLFCYLWILFLIYHKCIVSVL
jgi:cell fate regulator YaaT (PSP1 superfamily)